MRQNSMRYYVQLSEQSVKKKSENETKQFDEHDQFEIIDHKNLNVTSA